MKSRYQFKSRKKYRKYLEKYFSGLAMQAILTKSFDNKGEFLEGTILDAEEYGKYLAKQLTKKIKK